MFWPGRSEGKRAAMVEKLMELAANYDAHTRAAIDDAVASIGAALGKSWPACHLRHVESR